MEVQLYYAPKIFMGDLRNIIPGEALRDDDGERKSFVLYGAEKGPPIANGIAVDQLFPGGRYLKVCGEKPAHGIVADGKLDRKSVV